MNELTVTEPIEGEIITPEEWETLEARKKQAKEKWQTPKGQAEAVNNGHTTVYRVDGVIVQKNVYDKKIVDELITDEGLKLLSDPFFFSVRLGWEKRREAVLAIAGDVTDEDVISSNGDLSELSIDDGVDEARSKLKSSISENKIELKKFPIKINEANNAIHAEHDFDEINSEKLECQRELNEIEEELNAPAPVNPEIEKKRTRIKEISEEIFNLENEYNNFHFLSFLLVLFFCVCLEKH